MQPLAREGSAQGSFLGSGRAGQAGPIRCLRWRRAGGDGESVLEFSAQPAAPRRNRRADECLSPCGQGVATALMWASERKAVGGRARFWCLIGPPLALDRAAAGGAAGYMRGLDLSVPARFPTMR